MLFPFPQTKQERETVQGFACAFLRVVSVVLLPSVQQCEFIFMKNGKLVCRKAHQINHKCVDA